MKLIFLGSGSAFTVGDNFQSNMLIELPSKKRLMIDCGSDARHSLARLELSSKDIDAIYISHLHADHSGGLEWVAFTRKFLPPVEKPTLFVHRDMRETLWENQLRGSLQPLGDVSATLDTYFRVNEVEKTFHWENLTFELVPTCHIQDSGKWVPSFGVFFELNKNKIFITTDTQFSPVHFNDYYQKADTIFHDCETSHPESGVHTSYAQLKTLPDEIRNKTWLYHFNVGVLPDAKADGFLGFVRCGQTFDY